MRLKLPHGHGRGGALAVVHFATAVIGSAVFQKQTEAGNLLNTNQDHKNRGNGAGNGGAGETEKGGASASAPGKHRPASPSLVLRVLVDADACPVKEEIYKVACRYEVPVCIVANSYMRIPRDPLVEQIVVSAAFDAADDHIAGEADHLSVVVTADILLAERCLKLDATVIAPNGKPFTQDSIGNALATRALMADLRAGGDVVGGPPPFTRADRSRFLSSLDEALVRLKRNN